MLDVIAITDHNSCGNAGAVMEVAARAGILALPGMELCTSEECHVVCLFPDLESATAFSEYVAKTLPPIKNNPAIFGEQILMDADDTVVRHTSRMLAMASSISIDNTAGLVREYGGAAFPAHIDRPSYSVTAALGTVPDVGFFAAELSYNSAADILIESYPVLKEMKLLKSSDAHALEMMHDRRAWLELPERSAIAVIAALNGGECRFGLE